MEQAVSEAPVVLILGMHRSGTSCLAGCLESCGLFLGDISRRGRFNAKGNRESKTIWKLHDLILGLNRGCWHAPPEDIRIHPAISDRIREHIERLKLAGRPIGVKDPRTLLMLEHWKKLVGNNCRCVGTFRHPLAVARSLAERDGLSTQQALHLWVRYNAELVRHHRKSAFPLIEYDLINSTRYVSAVCGAARSVGLSARPGKVREFMAPALQHHQVQTQYISDECKSLYEYMKGQAVQHVSNQSSNRRIAWLPASIAAVRNVLSRAIHLPSDPEVEAA